MTVLPDRRMGLADRCPNSIEYPPHNQFLFVVADRAAVGHCQDRGDRALSLYAGCVQSRPYLYLRDFEGVIEFERLEFLFKKVIDRLRSSQWLRVQASRVAWVRDDRRQTQHRTAAGRRYAALGREGEVPPSPLKSFECV